MAEEVSAADAASEAVLLLLGSVAAEVAETGSEEGASLTTITTTTEEEAVAAVRDRSWNRRNWNMLKMFTKGPPRIGIRYFVCVLRVRYKYCAITFDV